MTKQLSAASMGNSPLESKAQFRGTLYVLRAVSMADYDKTIAQATEKDPETKEEIFDGDKHTRILLGKTLVEPKVTVSQLYDQDPRLVRAVQKLMSELYFAEEPDELKALKDDEERNGDGDEGEVEAAP